MELLVFSKDVFAQVIYQYSLLKNTWSTGMQMNVPRCLFGKESPEEIAIFAGGCVSQGKILSSAELYNSETGTWRTLRSMNKPQEYDLATGTWTEIPNKSPVRPKLRNGIPATSAAPPLVAAVHNQFTLLTMLKCKLGSMKSITKNGFIEVNSRYIVKDLKNGTCLAKSNQVALCTTVLSWDAEEMECGWYCRVDGCQSIRNWFLGQQVSC
ncbi:hypothetical protein T459_27336 [Capsicum annuum]|uniref:F-box/kelch-repeat protein n=1 Tax=Capsicum annuum TaxID=4072 RepID=A0A2G2YDS8_CAPAN|nr:putative transcription factor-like [Capsicum annuum]PHT67849.1 hypothetical protein T459_27336 [Capsicum annuum]